MAYQAPGTKDMFKECNAVAPKADQSRGIPNTVNEILKAVDQLHETMGVLNEHLSAYSTQVPSEAPIAKTADVPPCEHERALQEIHEKLVYQNGWLRDILRRSRL